MAGGCRAERQWRTCSSPGYLPSMCSKARANGMVARMKTAHAFWLIMRTPRCDHRGPRLRRSRSPRNDHRCALAWLHVESIGLVLDDGLVAGLLGRTRKHLQAISVHSCSPGQGWRGRPKHGQVNFPSRNVAPGNALFLYGEDFIAVGENEWRSIRIDGSTRNTAGPLSG
jgi:hypothetical protein